LSTLCTGRTLLPRNIIFLLLVLISVRGSVNPKTTDLMGNRSLDFPACSTEHAPSRHSKAACDESGNRNDDRGTEFGAEKGIYQTEASK
jgi:hypothetical protein